MRATEVAWNETPSWQVELEAWRAAKHGAAAAEGSEGAAAAAAAGAHSDGTLRRRAPSAGPSEDRRIAAAKERATRERVSAMMAGWVPPTVLEDVRKKGERTDKLPKPRFLSAHESCRHVVRTHAHALTLHMADTGATAVTDSRQTHGHGPLCGMDSDHASAMAADS